MSSAIRFSLPFKSLCFSCDQHYPKSAFRRASLATNHDVCSRKIDLNGGYDRIKALTSHSSVHGLESSLVSVKLEPISSESQFGRVVAEAQQLEESVVIVWMASWCRKCVYLKPKLEKLAADYYPRI
ncbi:hypothetical protein LOK49_LG12G02896 [Camellia lanceoleosa]|uniref:Uncharacterized protein n=1 Tax=Camellia lanceoleosa TaxID=1840588 RepID=A0ACC0FTU0_9ERIC|nr:hypothetical protein LOK49_LG12G02896 [Camellia lanceoleosa]